ncbi:MAG: YfhO family protein [Pontiellaceae bacterium]|nr:YfhO family protein [Pontiellaceae bacterium]
MKNDKIKFLLSALFFMVLAVITFRCALPADHVFSASDMNIGLLASKKNSLPSALAGTFRVGPVMGSTGYGISLFNVLLSYIPLLLFADIFYGLFIIVGSLCMIWFLRMWSRSWLASLFGALVAFWVNSITLASSGHAYKVEVLVFSVLALCLIEKAIRSELFRKCVGWAILAGLAVGIMMVEQQDVALLAGLFIGPYTLYRLIQVHRKKLMSWVGVLVPLAFVALLLAGSTVLKSYERNIKGAAPTQRSATDKWDYITQWSAVPEEWPDLIAPGWAGWSSQDKEGPYWGKVGQSPGWDESKKTQQQGGYRNFKLDSLYIGIVPFLLGIVGLFFAVKSRKSEEGSAVIFWSVAGVLGLWLAFGKYSILYKLFYHLPMVNNIRAPVKLLDNFQICLGIVSAYGLDRLLDKEGTSKSAKISWIVGFVVAGLALVASLKYAISPDHQSAIFSKMGYTDQYAELMVKNMSKAWLHAAVLTVIASVTILCACRFRKYAPWLAGMFVALLAVDSVMMTSHYFKADDISALKKGNIVVDYLKKNQGNERTYFVDNTGIYNQWLGMDSPYHGLNVFNIWQMPRMPAEYTEYLTAVRQNPVRLWQVSAINHVAIPVASYQQLAQNPELAKQFKPVLNYQVPTPQGMRPDVLLEFSGGIPRLALFHGWKSVPLDQHCKMLVSGQYNPLASVLVDASAGLEPQDSTVGFQPIDGVFSKKTVKASVTTDAPSILRFAQRYESGWKVFVDGKPTKSVRVDYLSMGVMVPKGSHQIEFRCANGVPQLCLTVSIVLGSLLSAFVLIRRRTGNRTHD